jgi:hypothetical protein
MQSIGQAGKASPEGDIDMTHAIAALTTIQTARKADPIPPIHLTRPADLAIRASLALMPFSALAWLFIAH